MKIRLITILIVVLTLLAAWFVPQFIASAKNEKPPVPHHNQEDKTVPANCHSKHAREAGMGCDSGTDDSEPKAPPNSTAHPLPKQGTEPETKAVTTAPGQVPKYLFGSGGGCSVQHMM